MKVYGYVYSNGTALCADHAAQLDPQDLTSLNENGPEYEVYSWEDVCSGLACDVHGCGVILEQDAEEVHHGA